MQRLILYICSALILSVFLFCSSWFFGLRRRNVLKKKHRPPYPIGFLFPVHICFRSSKKRWREEEEGNNEFRKTKRRRKRERRASLSFSSSCAAERRGGETRQLMATGVGSFVTYTKQRGGEKQKKKAGKKETDSQWFPLLSPISRPISYVSPREKKRRKRDWKQKKGGKQEGPFLLCLLFWQGLAGASVQVQLCVGQASHTEVRTV